MAEEHPYDRYDRACKQLKQAEENVEAIVGRVREIAQKLSNWRDLGIQDSYRVLGDAVRKATTQIVIEAKHWPTIQEVYAALAKYREACSQVTGAYQAMTIEQREKVGHCPV